MQKKSLLGNSLIWFGAAVSIAEILTGSLLAPLGWWKASLAILSGHAVGCVLLYAAGLIGARNSLTAMEIVKRSFGAKGGLLFAVLNLIQLVGWSAVMIAAGSRSACEIWDLPMWAWSCIIGILIAVWIMLKADELKLLNTVAVALLFILSVVLCFVIFHGEGKAVSRETATPGFGDALELVIAMPVSWLPLVADYTCTSSRPKTASFLSASVYFVTSCWMYFIGLGAGLYAGGSDIALLLTGAGLGMPALLIVIFSTVTTTYLDVYSSEMSMLSITKKIPPSVTGIAVCVIGVLAAIFCSTGTFEEFLYWIGSFFVPMIAIQIADFFVLKDAEKEKQDFSVSSLVIWAVGVVLYRICLAVSPPFGSTLPVMGITALLRTFYGILGKVRTRSLH